MTIATSSEQIAVRDSIASWARSTSVTDIVRSDLDKPSDQWTGLFSQIADLGVFAAAVPEASDGLGASFLDVAAMLEQCGVDLVPGPLGPTVTAAIALAVRRSDSAKGDDDPGAALLAEVLAGSVPVVTPATSHAGTGLVLADGELDLGLVAGYVEGCAVLVEFGTDDRERSWWIIPPGAGVADVTPQTPLDGTASVSHVTLSGVAVEDLVELGDGTFVAGLLSATLAAYQSGVTRWALDAAVDYAKVRTQFGVPIGSFQAIKHICAEMLCRSERVTAVAWDVAGAVDDVLAAGTGDELAPALEQLEISRLAADVVVGRDPVANTKDCVQVLGGIGFTFEHDAHLYLRAALAAQASLANASSHAATLARRGLAGARRRFRLDLSQVEDRRDEVRTTVARIADAEPDDRRRLLAETGYLTPHWPAPHGLGADAAMQLLIDTELEAAGIDRPDLVIGAWAIPTILEHGTDAQRERFVAPTLAGDIVWCQLFSEPEAGSDLAALRTRAERVDGGWRLDGQKIWTSQAHNARWAICLARTDPEAPKNKGITYFLVDMGSPGIDIRPLRELSGRANFNEVFLDGVVVPDDCVVGEINGGWRLARTTLANERVAMGGTGLGKEMESLLSQVRSMDRELTAEELASLGTQLADAHVGRVLDARAATRQLAGLDPGALSSVRKLIGVEHRQSVPDLALRLLGVAGLAATEASDAVLQNRCLSIAGGTTQILRTAAAERILGLPR
ncbi:MULTISPECIES: acyl-CoA dehydrogenase [unclassified Gordonia (in: high G+C Gram-positive bacteria)]|uniref:acyl-CoA dehydrogenase n=1 Tax=unclassified Gordonia (in: high G+C Gram-positive bacteria) TaxID=2657482 RepID=UPI00071DD2C0|nr:MULTISPECIES: acyl-CoA dehydrogenase [unclassified Gordonia (in: high G+C Gram-positive bacteria)]MDT0222336.1 acyl-CoA dehydrogenase [Gordonia sp. AC31]SCC13598.1 Acyl-CoA dehydrogenase [Gordonia sp. v-85]